MKRGLSDIEFNENYYDSTDSTKSSISSIYDITNNEPPNKKQKIMKFPLIKNNSYKNDNNYRKTHRYHKHHDIQDDEDEDDDINLILPKSSIISRINLNHDHDHDGGDDGVDDDIDNTLNIDEVNGDEKKQNDQNNVNDDINKSNKSGICHINLNHDYSHHNKNTRYIADGVNDHEVNGDEKEQNDQDDDDEEEDDHDNYNGNINYSDDDDIGYGLKKDEYVIMKSLNHRMICTELSVPIRNKKKRLLKELEINNKDGPPTKRRKISNKMKKYKLLKRLRKNNLFWMQHNKNKKKIIENNRQKLHELELNEISSSMQSFKKSKSDEPEKDRAILFLSSNLNKYHMRNILSTLSEFQLEIDDIYEFTASPQDIMKIFMSNNNNPLITTCEFATNGLFTEFTSNLLYGIKLKNKPNKNDDIFDKLKKIYFENYKKNKTYNNKIYVTLNENDYINKKKCLPNLQNKRTFWQFLRNSCTDKFDANNENRKSQIYSNNKLITTFFDPFEWKLIYENQLVTNPCCCGSIIYANIYKNKYKEDDINLNKNINILAQRIYQKAIEREINEIFDENSVMKELWEYMGPIKINKETEKHKLQRHCNHCGRFVFKFEDIGNLVLSQKEIKERKELIKKGQEKVNLLLLKKKKKAKKKKKIKKRKKFKENMETFYCSICKTKLNTKKNLIEHINGKKHKKNIWNVEVIKVTEGNDTKIIRKTDEKTTIQTSSSFTTEKTDNINSKNVGISSLKNIAADNGDGDGDNNDMDADNGDGGGGNNDMNVDNDNGNGNGDDNAPFYLKLTETDKNDLEKTRNFFNQMVSEKHITISELAQKIEINCKLLMNFLNNKQPSPTIINDLNLDKHPKELLPQHDKSNHLSMNKMNRVIKEMRTKKY